MCPSTFYVYTGVYLSGTFKWLVLRDYVTSDDFIVWNDSSITNESNL